MRLLVTRPAPDAEETAAALAALGHEVLLQPMLRVTFLDPPAALPDPAALVATSRNGVRALLAWPATAAWLDRPLFVTGAGTAQTATEAGFSDVRPGGADATALADRIVADFAKRRGPILYAAGRDRTGALAGGLSAAGYDVRTIIAYAAETVRHLDTSVVTALETGGIDGILFFSRRTAEAFRAAIEAGGLEGTLSGVTGYALSERVAEPLRPIFMVLHVADRPDFAGIAAIIGDAGRPQLA